MREDNLIPKAVLYELRRTVEEGEHLTWVSFAIGVKYSCYTG